jgi:serine/threonine-protein kinase
VIHRDIKPANLLLSSGGAVKLADFGLALQPEPMSAQHSDHGRFVGTPHYMSPEQCRRERADARSDVYSLGATYYALLTGQPPFPGSGAVEVMQAHLFNPAPDPRELNPEVPAPCAAVVARALSKSPAERQAGAAELLADLQALLTSSTGQTIRTVARPASGTGSRWRLLAVAAGAVAGAAAVLGLLYALAG